MLNRNIFDSEDKKKHQNKPKYLINNIYSPYARPDAVIPYSVYYSIH